MEGAGAGNARRARAGAARPRVAPSGPALRAARERHRSLLQSEEWVRSLLQSEEWLEQDGVHGLVALSGYGSVDLWAAVLARVLGMPPDEAEGAAADGVGLGVAIAQAGDANPGPFIFLRSCLWSWGRSWACAGRRTRGSLDLSQARVGWGCSRGRCAWSQSGVWTVVGLGGVV